ncbi:MAG TPA: hypothetical protein VI564_03850, partial [Candidatus Nanoarchaeia archaeon]|nr:hypothetical protein [Candidatus Nanoarchaeia archaeon]
TPFTAVNQNGTTRFPYKGCAETKSQCVHSGIENPFEEGIYLFRDSFYLNGSYYCDGAVWYGIFDSKKYCKKAGFEWDKRTKTCCGDAENENYIQGADKTFACCQSLDYTSENGKCVALRQCGNEVLDNGEQCEPPESDNNNYCVQSSESCEGPKLGIRSDKGYCNSKCRCEKTELEYSCVKGKCGAGCANDLDCEKGTRCDPQSCSCTSKKFCGDGILQQKNDFGQKEECEPSGSDENRYCKVEACKDKKSIEQSPGINAGDYSYAPCKGDCTCDYSVEYKCQKNVCGSECNDDGSGCENGLSCDINSCLCKESDICGNGICEGDEEKSCPEDCNKYECPYRITLDFDKNSYVLNDSEKITVRAFGINNNLMADVKFDLDILINNIFIGSSSYSTMDGEFAIDRKITNSAPSGSHTYIAKTRVPSCSVVVDSKIINVYVKNPYTIPPNQFNLSRFEFLTPDFNVTYDRAQGAVCGDNSVTYGEACEGYGVCRSSYGCDYENRVFDTPELCNGCSCPQDTKSEKNGFSYCQSCKTCGDGELNCNEECENGTKSFGNICRFGRVYDRVDVCSACAWEDDGPFSDEIVDDCKCDCNQEQSGSCVNGNYLEFNSDYYSGCTEGECNECSCADTYTKDTDNDGTEDKCEEELCANGIDDNDNGFVDEGKCQWYSCSQCGYGFFNFCTRTECAKFTQGCFFSEYSTKIFSKPGYETGRCNTCGGVSFCSEYGKDLKTCNSDPCGLGKCSYNGTACCTDSDSDKICDLGDNCPDIYNAGQEDDDRDGNGNTCDACPNEQALFTPQNFTEGNCSDGIDNDCDNLKDCQDSDCKGILECCQSSKDCRQDNCILENCINNKCDYLERNLCDNSECKKGQYCDLSGKCTKKDESAEICLFCTNDNLPSGYSRTVSFGTFFTEKSKSKETFCCGDEDSEYYLSNPKFRKSGCCKSGTDCVDEKGICHYSGELSVNQSRICIDGNFIDCGLNQTECINHKQTLQSIK